MWLMLAVARAGYGDPAAGVPSPLERETHAWTNAVRVDPEAFADAYPCGVTSFPSSARTPQLPLRWNQDLGDAARFHSEDMEATGDLSHTSSDGTSFESRLARFYPSATVGENVAWNIGDPYTTVVEGWMCSSGHRANIMDAAWNELGVGVAGAFFTQDFGQRGVSSVGQPLVMGAHTPESPSQKATFLAVFHHTDPPVSLHVVVNGIAHPMTQTYGDAARGVYTAEIPSAAACTTYLFRAQLAGGGTSRFPASGQYGFGRCAWDDPQAQWVAGAGDGPPGAPGFGWGDTGPAGRDDDASGGCGCTTGAAPTGAWAALLLLLVRRRR